MGHSSKKKKHGGSGRRRAPHNDHTSIDGVGGEPLSEELTALLYSRVSAYEDLDVSAFLSIWFLPGYPYKCPKLMIIPEKGLSKSDADKLLSLLHDQLSQKTVAVSSERPSKGPFVYGFIDLLTGSGESWHWGLSVEESSNTSITVDNLQNGSQPSWEKENQNMTTVEVGEAKLDKVVSSTGKVVILEEASKGTDSFTSQSEESVQDASIGVRILKKKLINQIRSDNSESASSASMDHNKTVGLRFCGTADQALPRLRGALPADTPILKALDELAQIFNYLRIWNIDKHVFIDPLMPPTEGYHRDSLCVF